MMNNILMLVFFLSIFINYSFPGDEEKQNAGTLLRNEKNTALVIYDIKNNRYIRFDSLRCTKRFLPASTYKIPNAMIGLETGVIPDSDYVIKWDGKPLYKKEWERDHTLKSAMYYSVVPYFQELARRVGRHKMQYWLNKLGYGNKVIGSKEDYFWLDNSLKISADEQVEFLKKLYYKKLPFSQRSMNILMNILPKYDFKDAIVKAKTGTGNDEHGGYVLWLVGYVRKSASKESESGSNDKGQSSKGMDGVDYIFAFNSETKTFDEAADLRIKIRNEMLGFLGIQAE